MKLLNIHKIRLIFILPIFNILVVSCAETKISKCQKIITMVNEVAKETKSLTNNQTEKDTQTWLTAADQMEEAAKKVKNLNLDDVNLQEYQQGFRKMYQAYAQATRDIVKARQDKDINAAKKAQADVQQAGQLEKQLGEKVNTYCQPEK